MNYKSEQIGYNTQSKRFQYKGVQFEVLENNFRTEGEQGFFCLYVIVADWQFTNTSDLYSFRDNKPHYQKGDPDPFDPCGQTQTFHQRLDGMTKYGCDYNHLWNQESGDYGSVSQLVHDAEISIDGLHEKYGLRVMNQKDGSIVTLRELEMIKEPAE